MHRKVDAKEPRNGNFLETNGVGTGSIKNAKNTKKEREKIHMKDLFNRISAKANYVDPEMAKEFYFALIKVIMAGIREDGEIQMPNWGTFKYKVDKPITAYNVNTGKMHTTKTRKMIKFIPCSGLKSYVSMMK